MLAQMEFITLHFCANKDVHLVIWRIRLYVESMPTGHILLNIGKILEYLFHFLL